MDFRSILVRIMFFAIRPKYLGFFVDMNFSYDVLPIIEGLKKQVPIAILNSSFHGRDDTWRSKVPPEIKVVSNNSNLSFAFRFRRLLGIARSKVVVWNSTPPPLASYHKKGVFLFIDHGIMGTKGYGLETIDQFRRVPSLFLVPRVSRYYLRFLKDCSVSQKNIVEGLLPREEIMLRASLQKAPIRDCLGIPPDSKLAVACFTFDYLHLNQIFPFHVDLQSLEKANQTFKERSAFLLIKCHHMQDFLTSLPRYSNIRFLNNSDLDRLGISVYALLGASDCLISDYSSITNDYLLLKRPIAYFLEGWNDYLETNPQPYEGISIDEMFPGRRVHCLDDVVNFVLDDENSETTQAGNKRSELFGTSNPLTAIDNLCDLLKSLMYR